MKMYHRDASYNLNRYCCLLFSIRIKQRVTTWFYILILRRDKDYVRCERQSLFSAQRIDIKQAYPYTSKNGDEKTTSLPLKE